MILNADFRYSECRFLIVMLSLVYFISILRVIMLNVLRVSVIILSVVAPVCHSLRPVEFLFKKCLNQT
jgi:hypothetical protein